MPIPNEGRWDRKGHRRENQPVVNRRKILSQKVTSALVLLSKTKWRKTVGRSLLRCRRCTRCLWVAKSQNERLSLDCQPSRCPQQASHTLQAKTLSRFSPYVNKVKNTAASLSSPSSQRQSVHGWYGILAPF